MTTISLSATDAILDLMPGQAEPRKAPVAAGPSEGLRSGQGVAPRFHLLPRAWREALEHRARQRELEMAFERLGETSAHLLADVGLSDRKSVKAMAVATWTRALPAPGAPAVRSGVDRWTLSRSRRRLMELEDHLLKDIGVNRAQARDEMRRPRWDPPEAWLR